MHLIDSLRLLILCGIALAAANKCTDMGGRCITRLFGSCRDGSIIDSLFNPYCGITQSCCMPLSTTTVDPNFTIAPGNCGKTYTGSSRIVGGTVAQKGAWPWQASLFKGSSHICGGSIITDRWIVTAAHCFAQSTSPSYYTVRVGEHQFSNNQGDHADHRLEKIILSSSWKGISGSVLGDIALIKLSSPISFSQITNTVCLPDTTDENDAHVSNNNCWVTGWGLTSGYGNRPSDVLNQVNGPIISNSKCNAYSYGWSGKVDSTQICFGTGKTSESACRGDSGGPLVCEKSGRYHLVGIVSWGDRFCKGKPSVFTRVTSYKNWILGILSSN